MEALAASPKPLRRTIDWMVSKMFHEYGSRIMLQYEPCIQYQFHDLMLIMDMHHDMRRAVDFVYVRELVADAERFRLMRPCLV